MKMLLILLALFEIATGVALLIAPSLVARLLLGAELTGVAVPLARVTGIALVGLGVSCWPGPAMLGMLIYGVLVALFLGYLGIVGTFAGAFLWPAVAVHLVLSVLLIIMASRKRQSNGNISGGRIGSNS